MGLLHGTREGHLHLSWGMGLLHGTHEGHLHLSWGAGLLHGTREDYLYMSRGQGVLLVVWCQEEGCETFWKLRSHVTPLSPSSSANDPPGPT